MLLPAHLYEVLFPLYMTVIIVGTSSNGCILFLAAIKVIKLTPITLLLLNISLADLMIDLNMVPYWFVFPADFVDSSRLAISMVCAFANQGALAVTAFIVNVLTLSYISFLRVSSFTEAKKGHVILKMKSVLSFILFTWIAGLAVLVPNMFEIFISVEKRECRRRERYKLYFHIFNALTAFFFWVTPLTIMFVNLILTLRNLWGRNMFQQSSLLKHRKQISLMLLGLPTAFLVFTTPNVVYLALRSTGMWSDYVNYDLAQIYRPILLVGLLTTISDPALYFFCRASFRNGFLDAISERNKRADNTKKINNWNCCRT